jgi:hypothetical protein
MALHTTPEDHRADPPSAWTVVKAGERNWHLDSSLGGTIGYFGTQREALSGKESGFYVDLYEREGRWFAGDGPQGWRPYAATTAAEVCAIMPCTECGARAGQPCEIGCIADQALPPR